MYYITGDYHLNHENIIKYCNRPFENKKEMDEIIIENHNKTVKKKDIVIFTGDLSLSHNTELIKEKYLKRLNGTLILLKGNHDYWLKEKRDFYQKEIDDQYIVASHYPMRSWNKSYHGSWNLHGHSHGMLKPLKNQLDIGIDNAYNLLGEYRPFSFDEVKQLINLE